MGFEGDRFYDKPNILKYIKIKRLEFRIDWDINKNKQ